LGIQLSARVFERFKLCVMSGPGWSDVSQDRMSVGAVLVGMPGTVSPSLMSMKRIFAPLSISEHGLT
jgi:hypothetical protein